MINANDFIEAFPTFRRATAHVLRAGFAAVVAAGISFATVQAQTDQLSDKQAAKEQKAVEQPVQEEAGEELQKKRDKLIADAVAAVDETRSALSALEKGRHEKALESLALATGKLELIIARNPELALAPVDANLITLDLFDNVDDIHAARDDIEEAFEGGEFQKARSLISGFGSELVVATTNLPLATYPEAIKLAAAQIDKGDIEGAEQTLRVALSTFVVTESVIPLPIARARLLLEKAEATLEGTDAAGTTQAASEDPSEASENAEASEPAEYIEAAREQLKMAEALGYGTEDDHESLRENLKELENKMEADEKTSGIFETIADHLAELRAHVFEAGQDEDS